MDAQSLFEAGRLSEAIQAVTDEVKKKPMDVNKRGFLCELLIIAREYDRADKQLDFIGHQNPDAIMTVAMWRQLLRASKARDEYFTEGRVPEVLEEPDELVQAYLKAGLSLREGKKAEAYSILEAAEEIRPKLSGAIDGNAFDDFRDLDDANPGVFELLTSTGKYYWIPYTRIESIEFHPPKSAIDLALRRATINTNKEGPEGEVFIPTIYPTVVEEDKEGLLLGRSTDWVGEEGEPIVGMGLRMFYVNDEAKSIMEFQELSFNSQ